jgi:serpin B
VKADRAAVVAGTTNFALSLYGQLRGKKGNLFLSPYSISTALAMTYAGARGRTEEQMARALHFPVEQARLHPAFASLLREAATAKDCQLSVANALWGQKGHARLPDFLALTSKNYGAGLRKVDFVADTEAARRTINGWVEKQTRDKIKDLLAPGILNEDTRLVLTNAIYFEADWASQFATDYTSKGPFFVTPTEKATVPLMHQQGQFRYADEGAFQAVEMPYKGGDLAMLVLLPKKVGGLAALERSLTEADLRRCLAKMKRREVKVVLPRFTTGCEFNLNDALKALGMTDAFVPRVADFSGIDGPDSRLFIQAAVHKAFVEVTERGTTAAAATAVAIGDEGEPPRATDFRADHPFLFLIRDNRSGSVLFLGRLADPRG